MGDLTRQLLYTPPEKRILQVRRAELLHDQTDPRVDYPFDYINYRITGYHSERGGEDLLSGRSILPDLRLMIDSLSRSVPIPVEADDPVESVRELGARLNVSTKTITRWRGAGLRWRWVIDSGKKHRYIAIPCSAIERFLETHHQRVERASRFSQLDPQLRRSVIDRARRMARSGRLTLNQVAGSIATRLGRGKETIRVILEQHDRSNPDQKIFVDHTGPLTAKQKRVIDRAHRIGVPVSRIARRFGRSASTIYRTIRRRRAKRVRGLEILYVYSLLFERDDADEVLLGTEVDTDGLSRIRPGSGTGLEDLPEGIRPIYRHPGLTKDLQRSLFVRFNYLKFKAARLRDGLDRYEPRVADLDEIESCLERARRIKNLLVTANLGTVLSVARRDLIDHDRSTARLVGELEIGNSILFEAVVTFDSVRDRAFESFLKWRLMQRFVGEHTGDNPDPKAHRKLDVEATLRRMRHEADRCDVRLPGFDDDEVG